MTDKFENFFDKAKGEALRPDEQALLEKNVGAFMAAHPPITPSSPAAPAISSASKILAAAAALALGAGVFYFATRPEPARLPAVQGPAKEEQPVATSTPPVAHDQSSKTGTSSSTLIATTTTANASSSTTETVATTTATGTPPADPRLYMDWLRAHRSSSTILQATP